ncbi:MAG: cytochrome c [Acidobacteria bacterium]|nr:cytochrome c [Acidobacteriota bacterium]
MRKRTISNLRESFLFRDPRGKVIFWGVLLAAVWYATYALHLWSPNPENQAFSYLSGSPTRGARLFSDLGCNACHGLYGVGSDIGPDLGTSLPAGSSPVRIVADMWNHSPQMWEKMRDAQLGFPRISEQDALDLLSYLYVVRYLDVPGDADKGEALFASKGCTQCHTLDGSRAGSGPDLGQLDAETPIVWAQRMWNHGQTMETLMETKNVPWPSFKDEEMLNLLAFLQKKSSGRRQEATLLPATPSRGKSLFLNKGCSSCHAVDGEGGQEGPDLGPRHEASPSIVQFAGLMWNHSPQMFAQMEKKGVTRPQFAEREMADLIAYLYLVRYLEPAGRVDLGTQVFNEKHCANCHGADGHGGREGPNLARRQPYYASQLAYTVWSHGPEMYRRMREKNISWPSLNEKELVDLVAFLSSL